MKLPSIPKMPNMPKMPRLSKEELREKLPFQPRREFVMSDSEHPMDAAAMEYRPSSGYVAPQPPVQPQPQPRAYRDIDQEMPFQQEMVYPGGGNRVPYATGGQARTEYTGSWPPPNPHIVPPEPSRVPVQPPRQEPIPPVFSQAEYYVPRQNYRPSPEFAQPRYYSEPPRQSAYVPPQAAYPHAPQAPQRPSAPRQDSAERKPQPGFGVKLAAMAGALLPKKSKAQPKQPPRPTQPSRQTPNYAAMNSSAAQSTYAPQQPVPQQPQRPALRPMELKYYIWSGSIVAGLLLTAISFIYACAV